MRKQYTYRSWLAVFFLGLYAFISTPTAFLHTHGVRCNLMDVDGRVAATPLFSNSQGTDFLLVEEECCAACAHTYLSYIPPQPVILFSGFSELSENRNADIMHNAFTLLHAICDRGPPHRI